MNKNTTVYTTPASCFVPFAAQPPAAPKKTKPDIVAELRKRGANHSDIIHAQNIVQAIQSAHPTTNIDGEVSGPENIVALSFKLEIGATDSIDLLPSIKVISSPINSVHLASVNFDPKYPVCEISMRFLPCTSAAERTARDNEKDRDRDRDRDDPRKPKMCFVNSINDSFTHTGLEGDVLAAAQAIQKYLINLHIDQKMVYFSLILDEDGKKVHVAATNVDKFDVFFIAQLLGTHPNISAVRVRLAAPSNESVIGYELAFEIDKQVAIQATASRGRSRSLFSREFWWK